jgi:phenylpropionate dioxygenase-like ring-hydroxylating dioxygenase large terminal subunit
MLPMTDLPPPTADEIGALVRPDRVHRRLYTDPAIFALEMDRIFGRAWLYVAHESQVARGGDILRARMGLEDVLVTRDRDGAIHVVLNRCAHRGAAICTAERGHAAALVCPYHGWTFALDGTVTGVPHKPSLPPDFDLADPAHSLARAPRVESYRGFVFASLAAEGEALAAHLGPMTEVFDNLIDRAPDGAIEQAGGVFRQLYRGNWKMHHENANDTLHPGYTHESSVAAARRDKRDYAAPAFDDHLTHTQMLANRFGVREWEATGLWGTPGGHSYMGGIHAQGAMNPDDLDDVGRALRERLVAKHGEARADAILGLNRYNNLIWPNLSVNSQHQQLRIVTPLAVDRTLVQAMCFRLKGAPERQFQRAVRILNNISSPASTILVDDIEIFERVQRGLANDAADWIDLSRGLGMEAETDDGRIAAGGISDLPMRTQYAAWLRHMTAA